jgi:hypothetical protein
MMAHALLHVVVVLCIRSSLFSYNQITEARGAHQRQNDLSSVRMRRALLIVFGVHGLAGLHAMLPAVMVPKDELVIFSLTLRMEVLNARVHLKRSRDAN